MPRILVTPLSALPDAVQRHRPSHIVTLLSPEHMIDTPPGFPADNHLKLGMNDVVDRREGEFPPARYHVEELLAFARQWPADSPMIVHCWAGVSRSMAASYIVLCDRLGPGCEQRAAKAIRERAPHAYPNALLVEHADAVLGRGGRMVAAIRSIGAGAMVTEGNIVELPLAGL